MKRVMRIFFVLIILLDGVFGLVACHKTSMHVSTGPHPLTPYQRQLVSEIRSSGAYVVKQAEVMQIIIPIDRFFRSQSTNLKSSRLGAINRIATLVKSYASYYRHPRILVSGYTDMVFARERRKQLSKEYALEVAAYLWNKSVSRRWVSVRGYGAKHPIASQRTVRGGAYNRRVVIRIS